MIHWKDLTLQNDSFKNYIFSQQGECAKGELRLLSRFSLNIDYIFFNKTFILASEDYIMRRLYVPFISSFASFLKFESKSAFISHCFPCSKKKTFVLQ